MSGEQEAVRVTLKAMRSIFAERSRQDAKWGQQNHDPARWLMILGEEYGEACEAGCRLTWPAKIEPPENQEPYRKMCLEDFRKELVHVAAVAMAMIECIDRKERAR